MAGKVIERPASVVKESVENSIDGSTTMVLIEVVDGGKSLVKVTDDGCGWDLESMMPRERTASWMSTRGG